MEEKIWKQNNKRKTSNKREKLMIRAKRKIKTIHSLNFYKIRLKETVKAVEMRLKSRKNK